MMVSDAIKTIMRGKKITQMELAEMLDTKQNNISMYLKTNQGMRVDSLLRILDACGCDLIVTDRDNPKSAYVIGEDKDTIALPKQDAGDESIDERVRRIVAEELRKAGTTTASDE